MTICSSLRISSLFSVQYLIVSLTLHPVAGRKSPHDELSRLIVAQYDEGERESREPPEELDALHLQDLVHAGAVTQEGGQSGLEEEGEVELAIPHPLLEQGVLPRLADQETGPLDNHDGDEEGGLAGALQFLPVSVGPLLAVGILEVVNVLVVPRPPQVEQSLWEEAVLRHDDEVGEEPGRSLNESQLAVAEEDDEVVTLY